MSDRISDGLQHAIDEWLDVEGASAGPGQRLEDLWVEEKGIVTPYQPDGVRRLIGKVQDESVFEDCERARNLDPGQFGPTRIDTFGDLVDHLVPCDS
jgi:hypothetical protein